MTQVDKVFHSTCEQLRKKLHIILVHPELGANIGAAARAIENMGLLGEFIVVGNKSIIDAQTYRMAKHAKDRVNEIKFFDTFQAVVEFLKPQNPLKLAATARVGSVHRPHPQRVHDAAIRAVHKLKSEEVGSIALVFGPESIGLTNEEIELCDWVVTIPSTHHYRSLNLAQAVLIFAYEANMALIEPWEEFDSGGVTQRDKLIFHMIRIAEEAGFILPGDPFKMKPRLEEIFSKLPRFIPEVQTLHGLLDQIRRTMKKQEPDYKGRYKRVVDLKGQEHVGEQ